MQNFFLSTGNEYDFDEYETLKHNEFYYCDPHSV